MVIFHAISGGTCCFLLKIFLFWGHTLSEGYSANQWIGFLGKIFTGNHRYFPMKIMGLSGENFPQQTNGIMASEAATTSWVKAWYWMSPTPSRPLLPSTNWRLEGEKALNQWPHDETIQFIEIYCRICHLTSSTPSIYFLLPQTQLLSQLDKKLHLFFLEYFWSHW